jgi:hypothetical protein
MAGRDGRNAIAMLLGFVALAVVAFFAYHGGAWDAASGVTSYFGGGGIIRGSSSSSNSSSSSSSSSSSNSVPREVVAANAVAGNNDAPLSQQYADAKSGNDARFSAKVTADAYQTDYTEESKVDCGECRWVLRDLDQCCERDCNADPTTSNPYYCSGSDVAGDKMYDCHAGMCKEATMGKHCNAAVLKTIRQNSTTADARCSTYKRKVLQGPAVQTCLTTVKGKCTQWSK